MNERLLLEAVTTLGYRLAMAGAETFRVEETILRVLKTYGYQAEAFAIPNCLIVSIETPEGKLMTRMRRIGYHGNDLDGVECFNAISRAICNRKPSMEEARKWFDLAPSIRRNYSLPLYLLGNIAGAFGFAFFFGGNLNDAILSGICGLVAGLMGRFMGSTKTNPFFKTIASSFAMALLAYAMAGLGMTNNVDAVIIGSLMILVPGLLFTNAEIEDSFCSHSADHAGQHDPQSAQAKEDDANNRCGQQGDGHIQHNIAGERALLMNVRGGGDM